MHSIIVEIGLDAPVGYKPHGEDEIPVSLGEAILEAAAARLVDGLKREPSYRDLRQRVEKIRDEEIRAVLRTPIREAVEAAMQPTNTFGQPKGEPLTLHELVVKEATAQLKKAGERASLSDRRPRSLVEAIVHDEVERAFGQELRATIAEAKEEVRLAVREKGAEVLTEAISGRLS